MKRERLNFDSFINLVNPYTNLKIDKKRTHFNTQYLSRETKKWVKEIVGDEKIFAVKAYDFTSPSQRNFPSHINRDISILVFTNCTFDFELFFEITNYFKQLIFVECDFWEKVNFRNLNFNVSFVDCAFTKDLLFDSEDKSFEKKIQIFNTELKESLNFLSFSGSSDLSIEGKDTRLEKGLDIIFCKFRSLAIKNTGFLGRLFINWDDRLSKNCYFDRIEIKNTEFGDLQIRQSEIKREIEIENISVIAKFILNSNIVKDLKIGGKFDSERNYIKNCKIEDLLFHDYENSIDSKFELKEGSTFKDIHFNRIFSGGNFKAENIKVLNQIDSSGSAETKQNRFETIDFRRIESEGIYLNFCHVDGLFFDEVNVSIQVRLYSSRFSNIQLQKCSLGILGLKQVVSDSLNAIDINANYLLLEEIIAFKNVTFNRALTENPIIMKKSIILEDFSWKESTIRGIEFRESIVGLFKFSEDSILKYKVIKVDRTILNRFRLLSVQDIEYYITSSQINLLEIFNTSFSKVSTLSISDTHLNSVDIRYSNLYGNVYFRNCGPNRNKPRILESEFNKSVIDHLKEGKYDKWFFASENNLTLFYSSLGNTEFIEFLFNEYTFLFNNTKLIDCFIAGSQFPETVQILQIEEQSKEYYNQKVLVYNQLKKIADRNGDIVKSSLMHSKALANQKKVLSFESGKQSEKFVFWLNGVSNDHGESWSRALLFTLMGTLFFFVLYIWAEGKYAITGEFDPEVISDYVKFIDPFRRIDFTSHWSSNLIYFINKIWFSFGVFQLVTAFRRHGKK